MGGSRDDQGKGVALDGDGNVYTTGSFAGTVDFDPGPGVFNLTSATGEGFVPGLDDIFVSKLDSAGNFVWARQMGGPLPDEGNGLAVDGSGNVYVIGSFKGSADFDPGPGVFNLGAGGDDIFVSKLDSSGNFVWARQMDGTRSYGVAVDGGGNVYTTGAFRGTADFDPGPGVFALHSAGSDDIFVSKLDSAGNFVWARRMGGTAFGHAEWGIDVAVDDDGNVYTTGLFASTDFDAGPGTVNLAAAGTFDMFVSKFDSAGNFVWARQMGGSGDDQGKGVALDGDGNVYTTGSFVGRVDFDPGPGVFALHSAGSDDIFVSKLDSAGNFVWAGQMGGRAGWLAATSMAWLWTATAMSTRRGLSAIPSTSTPAPASST
jgi:hypothetical protein